MRARVNVYAALNYNSKSASREALDNNHIIYINVKFPVAFIRAIRSPYIPYIPE